MKHGDYLLEYFRLVGLCVLRIVYHYNLAPELSEQFLDHVEGDSGKPVLIRDVHGIDLVLKNVVKHRHALIAIKVHPTCHILV